MKRVGFIINPAYDREYIKNIIVKASVHKTERREVQNVLADIDKYTDIVHEMIVTGNIWLKPTKTREIRERGKTRIITILPFFPNQILDYLLVELVKPIIRKSMYQYCVGNVNKRGNKYGYKYARRISKKYKYKMKCDIRKFYQNVNTSLLIKMLERKIKDKKFIEFARKIIDPNELPIGCYYSQWLSNFFLCEYDHYVKEKMRAPAYARNVDDMVFASNNKKALKGMFFKAKQFLFNIYLEFKYLPNVKDSLNFLGYVFKNNITKLRHSIFYKIQRTIKKMRAHVCFSLVTRMISYLGWIKTVDVGYSFYKNNIEDIIKIGKLRRLAAQGGI